MFQSNGTSSPPKHRSVAGLVPFCLVSATLFMALPGFVLADVARELPKERAQEQTEPETPAQRSRIVAAAVAISLGFVTAGFLWLRWRRNRRVHSVFSARNSSLDADMHSSDQSF